MTREEAIEALTSKDVHNSDIMFEALDMAVKALEQEPKIGHWIYDKKSDLSKCSICGAYCPHDELGRIETYYCSYCGAKM